MSQQKKILENPLLAGIAVPLIIVLGAALIIWGVTRMLNSERGHRELLSELESKTFGNRWVAAYELSKLIAAQKIPAEDMDTVAVSLSDLYTQRPDERSRNFIVTALGALKHPRALATLQVALDDPDPQVSLNALVAIGNMPMGVPVEWSKVISKLQSTDPGIRQAAIYTIIQHDVPGAAVEVAKHLSDPDTSVSYAAAIALIKSKNTLALPVLQSILQLKPRPVDTPPGTPGLDAQQDFLLKMNVLNTLGKYPWPAMEKAITDFQAIEENPKLKTKAQEILLIFQTPGSASGNNVSAPAAGPEVRP